MKKVILILLFLGMVGLLSSCTLSLDFHPEGKKAETTKWVKMDLIITPKNSSFKKKLELLGEERREVKWQEKKVKWSGSIMPKVMVLLNEKMAKMFSFITPPLKVMDIELSMKVIVLSLISSRQTKVFKQHMFKKYKNVKTDVVAGYLTRQPIMSHKIS